MSARSTSTRSSVEGSRRSPRVGRAYARAQIYAVLALLCSYPTRERRARLADLAPIALAAAEYLRLPHDWLQRCVADARSDEAREAAYQHCFTLTYSPDVPPYEVAYISSDIFRQTEVMADVAGFYRAFGLDVGGNERERVDHVAVELTFMQWLCLKEAYAAEHSATEALDAVRRGQRSFLADHLLCWAPAFARRVSTAADGDPYDAIGAGLGAWLEHEQPALRVEPRHSYDRPFPPELEPPLECAVGSAAPSFIPIGELT